MAEKDRKFTPRGKGRSIRGERGGTADWASADANAIKRAIECASAVGGALRFGYSGDGGAYAVGCYFEGESWTEFIRPAEDIDDWLEQASTFYEEQGMSVKDGQKVTEGLQQRKNGSKG